MAYRNKTYIAGDWTGDKDAIDKLYEWNDNGWLKLSFYDAHELTQAKDSSLNCSIKASLRERLNNSKRFVLVVGENTKGLRSGSCQYCGSYNARYGLCERKHSLDMRSYIEYECDRAVADSLDIVVLYNDTRVDKHKCPDAVKDEGRHVAMVYYKDGQYYWDYSAVRDALA